MSFATQISMASIARSMRSVQAQTQSVRPLITRPWLESSICAQCRRSFVSSPALESGHNKWSKIKHDKAANDAKKTAARTYFTKHIALSSKLHGPDPNHNAQLAAIIVQAKKAGVPKDKIEQSIARGQGRSSEGAVLDSMTFEALIPPSIALIIDLETDNKLRVLQDINQIIKKARGAQSNSKFFFSRVGRVVFEKDDGGLLDADAVMDEAIEAGAEDLENDENGDIVVWTQPNMTAQISQAISAKFNLKVRSSEIVWSANKDTEAKLEPSPSLPYIIEMFNALGEYSDVQAIYSNVTQGTVSDEEWERIAANLDG